jgi:hypothetical protein
MGRADWRSGNSVDLCAEDAGFEPHPGHYLS